MKKTLRSRPHASKGKGGNKESSPDQDAGAAADQRTRIFHEKCARRAETAALAFARAANPGLKPGFNPGRGFAPKSAKSHSLPSGNHDLSIALSKHGGDGYFGNLHPFFS
jgi:hypothetical protein